MKPQERSLRVVAASGDPLQKLVNPCCTPVATALRHGGCQVIYVGHQDVKTIADLASDLDADAICLLNLSRNHRVLLNEVLEHLSRKELQDVLLCGTGLLSKDETREPGKAANVLLFSQDDKAPEILERLRGAILRLRPQHSKGKNPLWTSRSESKVLRRVDAAWARMLGCLPEDLSGTKTIVVPNTRPNENPNAFLFRRGQACILSVPEDCPRRELESLPFEPELLAAGYAIRDVDYRAPRWISVLEKADSKAENSPARPLTDADTEAFDRLIGACGHGETFQSAITGSRKVRFGLFVGEMLVAASGFEVLAETLAVIGVLVHPDYRKKGHGRTMVRVATKQAQAKDLVPTLYPLMSNPALTSIGRSLGFRPYALTMFIELAASDP